MESEINLVWLRRDMRLHDHTALAQALEAPGSVQPVFVLDTEILARFTDLQDRRLSFIAAQLCRLHAALHARGGGLLVLHGAAVEVMPRLCAALGAARLVAARDVEPAARARDKAVYEALKGGTGMTGVWDHLLLPPEAVMSNAGGAMRVFTPYYKRWMAMLDDRALAERTVRDAGRYAAYGQMCQRAVQAGLRVLEATHPDALLEAAGYRHTDTGAWQPGHEAQRLEAFTAQLAGYKQQRDMLAMDGTSQFSPYLRFGLLSPRECARLYIGRPGAEKWLSEMAWRDFYAMILYHHPEVVEHEFQPRFRGLAWENDPERFRRWQEGMTGYPVVDAAMRQLRDTGWMHNRARMITASFLTKDLLVDWRRGEEHFAQLLMDYDLASNNGGWQWAASTGTDAQPWFRIFNPVLQGRKFDPEGAYVRRYVPELRDMPGKYLHEPWLCKDYRGSYPPRIVDHYAEREKALRMFKEMK